MGRGPAESGLGGGGELAGVGPAVRVSALGSLAGLVQPVSTSSALQTAMKLERRSRFFGCIEVAAITKLSAGAERPPAPAASCVTRVSPGYSRQLLGP